MLQYEVSPFKLDWMTNSIQLWNMRSNIVSSSAQRSDDARSRRRAMNSPVESSSVSDFVVHHTRMRVVTRILYIT
jgi:hypothetical protein